jgi:hypothetical protein
MANYSFTDPGDAIPDGAVINKGNFTQMYPDTPIMVGKPLTINGGNFTNVRKDPNWIINGGNWTQVSRCSHLHPEWIPRGLAECPENCEHVTYVDTIEVGGQVIDTIYTYEDIVQ